jgi:hypothetical protein
VKGRSAKQKGDNYERELAAFLSDRLGITARRAPLSGGGVHAPASGDILGTPLISIEAKAVQALNIREAMAQSVRNAGADIPIVINRRNREATEQSLVTIRLCDFLQFYEALLFCHDIPTGTTPATAQKDTAHT